VELVSSVVGKHLLLLLHRIEFEFESEATTSKKKKKKKIRLKKMEVNSASRRLAVVQSHLTQSSLTTATATTASTTAVVVPAPTFSTSISTDSSIVRHGGDLVAEALVREGVKFLFTLVGGHVSPVLTSARERGIRVVDVRHEVNTVFAADAVARVAGGVGVACVTAGPGLTNTITSLKNAQMANSPLILLGGATATLLKGRGALQDIDQQVRKKMMICS